MKTLFQRIYKYVSDWKWNIDPRLDRTTLKLKTFINQVLLHKVDQEISEWKRNVFVPKIESMNIVKYGFALFLLMLWYKKREEEQEEDAITVSKDVD